MLRSLLSLLLAGAILALAPQVPGQDKAQGIADQVKALVKEPGKPFTMLVTLQAKDGTQARFESAFAKAVKATRKEKGCLAYDLNRDGKTPTQYVLYERWQDFPSLEAHLKTAHIATLLGELGDLLAGPPEVRVLTPASE